MELAARPRIDWLKLAARLRAECGMSLQNIADAIGISKSTLHGYLDPDCPAEPMHCVGRAFTDLCFERLGLSLDDAPVREGADLIPRHQVLRGSVMDSEGIAHTLAQMHFSWFGASPQAQAESVDPMLAILATPVRMRFGVAETPWNERGVSGFVVYTEEDERRAAKSPGFKRWVTEWEYEAGKPARSG